MDERVRVCTTDLKLDIECSGRLHPHRQAHWATGETDDGVRYSVFWWSPAAARAVPDRPANPNPDTGPLEKLSRPPKSRPATG